MSQRHENDYFWQADESERERETVRRFAESRGHLRPDYFGVVWLILICGILAVAANTCGGIP